MTVTITPWALLICHMCSDNIGVSSLNKAEVMVIQSFFTIPFCGTDVYNFIFNIIFYLFNVTFIYCVVNQTITIR